MDEYKRQIRLLQSRHEDLSSAIDSALRKAEASSEIDVKLYWEKVAKAGQTLQSQGFVN